MNKKQLLKSSITNASFQEVAEHILSLAHARTSTYVCIANVHMLIEAWQHPEFHNLLEEADIATPDGKPLSIFMNLLYGTRQERVAGPDLMVELFKGAQQRGISVYFYGSTPEVLSVMQAKLAQEYPGLKVAGAYSPPFGKVSDTEQAEAIAAICESGAQIVFVALGCPKQERWMHQYRNEIPAVMVGVGAAFPFFTGHLKRSPRWMQDLSLEWLYRLLCEPGRLFWRYLITNSLFLGLIIKQLVATCWDRTRFSAARKHL